MSALPIRIRLTLPFAFAMACVLVAMGVFVYVRLGETLLSGVDQNLRAQVTESEKHLHDGSQELLDRDASAGPSIGQLLGPTGTVLLSEPATKQPLLVKADRLRVLAGRHLWLSSAIPARNDRWRLFAVPVKVPSGPAVLVVARSLAARDESLRRLERGFLLAGPLALLLAIGAGYGLAAAALRPVEAMRRRAEEITTSTEGRRLPVPGSHDEISRLAETLNDMLGRLEAAAEHERRFLADASHELRTPLALLRTELELALRRPRSHEELVAALRSASEETERMTRLAEDILLIARSDQDGIPIRRERVSAKRVFDRIAERFEPRAASSGRTITVAPGSELELDLDPVRIEQAIGNLVENALSHGAGAITLSARPGQAGTELHVSDQGPGFPPGFASRAFDRFSRAADGRSPGGTGLGLAIVDLIATAHGGSAALANLPGGGADVWITVAPGVS